MRFIPGRDFVILFRGRLPAGASILPPLSCEDRNPSVLAPLSWLYWPADLTSTPGARSCAPLSFAPLGQVPTCSELCPGCPCVPWNFSVRHCLSVYGLPAPLPCRLRTSFSAGGRAPRISPACSPLGAKTTFGIAVSKRIHGDWHAPDRVATSRGQTFPCPPNAAPGHGRQALIPQCQHRVGNEPFMLVMIPIDSPQPPLNRRDHAW